MLKPFTPKSVKNKPQTEERVNSRLYSGTQKKKIQNSSAIKKQSSTIVNVK